VTEGHVWVPAASYSTLAPWQSEQLWPYYSLMSLDTKILHSGHTKSLHLVHHPRIDLGSHPWQRRILPLDCGLCTWNGYSAATVIWR